jgi:hypothetical protein
MDGSGLCEMHVPFKYNDITHVLRNNRLLPAQLVVRPTVSIEVDGCQSRDFEIRAK